MKTKIVVSIVLLTLLIISGIITVQELKGREQAKANTDEASQFLAFTLKHWGVDAKLCSECHSYKVGE